MRYKSLGLLLVFVCFIAAAFYLHRGASEAIEYDGYWHIWVAAQTDWHQFVSEYKLTSHPPLFFLLLKFVMFFSRTALAFRAVSIISAIGAVFVIGKTAAAITKSRVAAVLAVVLFGLSTPTITLATEVRSYMLALLWITLAFYYYVRIWQTEGKSKRPVAWFGVFSSLAMLSHYFTVFFMVACVVAPVYLAIVNREYRTRIVATVRRSAVALAASFGWVAALSAYLYFEQARMWAILLNHLPDYYYQKGTETIPAFLWRTTRILLDSFLPLSIATDRIYIICLLIIGAGIVFAIYQFHVRARLSLPAAFPSVFLMLITLGLAAAAILDKYPYGGAMRQQSVILPFAVLTTVLVIQELTAGNRRVFAATLGIIAALCVYKEATYDYPGLDAPLHPANMFRVHFPAPDSVFTDRYSFLAYFMALDDRDWTYLSDAGGTIVYQPAGRQLVFRNIRWNFDFRDPAVYSDMRQLLRAYRVPSITMFCTRQFPFIGDAAATVRQNAAAAGLDVDKIYLDGKDVYARFIPAATAGVSAQAAFKSSAP